jgi:hypothetical protein
VSTVTTHRPTALLAVLIAGAVAVAGCGSGGSSAQASGGTTTKPGVDQVVKFADCMRAHGVPSFPDPTSGGPIRIGGPGSGIDSRSPAFQAALRACRKLQPGGGGPKPMSESQKLAAIAFARCVRKHGVPDFPDPSNASAAGPSPGHLVVDLRGMTFALGPGLDPRSPAFTRAAAACGLPLPGKPGDPGAPGAFKAPG